jgi:hypothetical protein
MHNIEKSAFRRGEYVGYACGVWHIVGSAGAWRATKREGGDVLSAGTLADLSTKLARYAAEHPPELLQ